MAGGREERRSTGSDRQELARLLSCQFESLGESRPSRVRVAEEANTVSLAFGWPLAPWEAILVRSGQQHRLERFRLELLEAIAPSLAEVVEIEIGREARSRSLALAARGQEATVGFALGGPTEDGAESRRAIRNWSLQVRRSARHQRSEHRRQVERLKRATEAMRRAKSPSGR
jgi:hypothetical protein